MISTENLPQISVVIPNCNGAPFLEDCLSSLRDQTCPPHEIIMVDNGSTDASREIASAFPGLILIENEKNDGFAAAVNAGIRAARGDWIAVLNNDTTVSRHWLAECRRAVFEYPTASFFACRILNMREQGRVFSAGDCFLRAGIGYRRGQEQEDREEFHRECRVFAASGCAAFYKKKVLEEIGGFDERFFAYLEDVDLGLRLQAAGYHGYYLPQAEVFHHGGGTSGGEFSGFSVRLRTRNGFLLLMKSVPALHLLRSLPMIALSQASWLARAAAHGRIGSYLRGVVEACLLLPAMIRERARLRPLWRHAAKNIWHEILQSEALAREDFTSSRGCGGSLFLKWYFRLF